MGIEAQVTVREDAAHSIVIDINAADLGLVIGSEGETLNAIQTLVRAITAQENTQRIPILLDGQGYRARREAALVSQALALSEQVKQTRKEAVLEGLSAYERRVVHLALANDPAVTTYSEGEGAARRLVVSPAE